MAWIRVIAEDEAHGRLKELYEKYTELAAGGADGGRPGDVDLRGKVDVTAVADGRV